jgi:biopolymer transport protein ExbB/TolQ
LVQKEKKKEEDSRREAEDSLTTLTTAREKTVELQTRRDEEERRLEEIVESLKDSTQEIRGRLEQTQAELAEAERSVATLQVRRGM